MSYLDDLKQAHDSSQEELKIISWKGQQCVEVEPLDMQDVRNDSVGMHKIMYGLQRAGLNSFALSHPQVNGVRKQEKPLRFFTMNPYVEGWNGPLLIINPTIQGIGSPKRVKESCLSFPHKPPIDVYRYYKVMATFYDETWQEHQEVLRGVQAQIFQHEIEHMDGKSIYDSVVKSGISLPGDTALMPKRLL